MVADEMVQGDMYIIYPLFDFFTNFYCFVHMIFNLKYVISESIAYSKDIDI